MYICIKKQYVWGTIRFLQLFEQSIFLYSLISFFFSWFYRCRYNLIKARKHETTKLVSVCYNATPLPDHVGFIFDTWDHQPRAIGVIARGFSAKSTAGGPYGRDFESSWTPTTPRRLRSESYTSRVQCILPKVHRTSGARTGSLGQ